MNNLKEKFRKNGLPYTLLQRNEALALYGVGGTYTDKILHYEVCRIYLRNDKYGHRESLPSNERFGRDGSNSFVDYEDALSYFDAFTSELRKAHKGHKVMSGVEENVERVAEFHLHGPLIPMMHDFVVIYSYSET